MNFEVQVFEKNKEGRDLVVGDIHGMWRLLYRYLKAIRFDPKKDRLFAAGDLVDRGPEPKLFLDWIDRPYFYAVLGNHDANIIQHSPDIKDIFMTYSFDHSELSWFKNAPREEQIVISKALSTLPFAIELRDGDKKVGIVHACSQKNWEDTVRYIENPYSYLVKDHILWSREAANKALAVKHIYNPIWDEEEIENAETRFHVEGVDWLFHGHTVDQETCEPYSIANRYYIDGGACYIRENPKAGFIIADAWNPKEPVMTPRMYEEYVKREIGRDEISFG